MIKLAGLALALGGCSFLVVRGAPPHADRNAACTESQGAPAIDTAVAAIAGLGGIALATARSSCDSTTQDCPASNLGVGVAHTMGAVLVTTGVVYAFGALYGFATTGECRRIHVRPTSAPAP